MSGQLDIIEEEVVVDRQVKPVQIRYKRRYVPLENYDFYATDDHRSPLMFCEQLTICYAVLHGTAGEQRLLDHCFCGARLTSSDEGNRKE